MSLDAKDLDRHITGNYGEDSVPRCDCPCMDCIEGTHCGEGQVIEGLDGAQIEFTCEYLVDDPLDSRPDDFDE